ncbi:dolichyl-phosphate-mannose--protein mannosyltransferase [Malassezia sp. CBS 17886]|nr:dolichyl-phosphate-mannose--protein mannosyltransferase [Malassezia sp. CBS 17886]
MYHIAEPSEVVFDEVHFGKYASYYLKRTYFFDVHPPLAKLIIALAAWLARFDGKYEFDTIGEKYTDHNVPYAAIRAFLALLGALQAPLVYQILRATGVSVAAALVSAAMLVFDNAHATQSRLILLDAPLVLFLLASLYCYIRFYAIRYREFTPAWWGWLCMTGVFLALTISCKMVGFFAFCTVGAAVVLDLWDLLDIRRGLSVRRLVRHLCARALFLIVVPVFVYLGWFWVHFAVLTESGPGDTFMSAAFQQTLSGNELLQQARELHAFDTVTIKHRGTDVFLHSHNETYPLKYDDGRISSNGRQVTGYPFVDSNNEWQIVPVDPVDDADGSFNETRRRIFHKQQVRLRHVGTDAFLMAHDVASPLMPTNEEITTIPAEHLSEEEANARFEVHIQGGAAGKTTWHSHRSWFHLIHVPTRVALWTYAGGELPDWAFNQQEVNGNKNAFEKTAVWYVDDVRPDPDSPSFATRTAPPPPRAKRSLPFMRKFLELQGTMLQQNNRLTMSHPYASRPISWPFLTQGVSYWTHDASRRQVFFIGNPLAWWLPAFALSVFGGLMFTDMLLRRRGIFQIPTAARQRFLRTTGWFALAWAFHYLPFFGMHRQLFLHHYLPAHVCAVLAFGGVLDFFTAHSLDAPLSPPGPGLDDDRRRRPMRLVQHPFVRVFAAAAIAAIAAVFVFLAPVTYGDTPLSVEAAKARKMLPGWQLQFIK